MTDGDVAGPGTRSAEQPARPAPEAPHPQPVDPMDPLKRDPGEADEGHPGTDPVVRPVPPG